MAGKRSKMVCVVVALLLSLAVTGMIFSVDTVNAQPPDFVDNLVQNRAENAAQNGAATFIEVEGYSPWAVCVINAGKPDGIDAVTVSFKNETLTISATDSDSTQSVHILINKAFADKYLADSEGDLDIDVSDAVNYEGIQNENVSADDGNLVYVFHINHFSTQYISISESDGILPSIPFMGLPLLAVASIVAFAVYSVKRKRR